MYKSTKEVLKDFRSNQEDKLQHHLTSQGFFFSNVIKYSLSSVNSIWSEAQSHLPKNIYNFTIRYINNSLPTRKDMARWGLSQSPDCSFCLNPESLLHVVAGCQQYLDRFTWRHDSILNFIAKSLKAIINVHCSHYADVNGFLNPSRLQNSPYFCVFKYARAVKQKVGNEAENRERDWGETLKIRFSRLTRV